MIRSPFRSFSPSTTSSFKHYVCKSCQLRTPLMARRFMSSTPRKRAAEYAQQPLSQQPAPQRAPDMKAARQYFKHRNRTMLNYTISLIIGVVAASYASVPLYKTICQQMGWGGQPVKSKSHFAPSAGDGSDDDDMAARVVPQTDAHRIRITFSGSTSSILPWRFTPQQREVRVLPGETALAFYTATNTSNEDVIGVATYSVTPDKVAPYFSKIQCFCFEEQRLAAGESVDMPVFFYIDPDFVKDLNVRKIETVTLHYTFFKAKYDKAGHLYPVPMRA